MRRDVCGAKNAGLSAIWIHNGSSEEKTAVRPDFIISDLKDIIWA
jgi:FMN phosphatase YigB (HAD superfamily)